MVLHVIVTLNAYSPCASSSYASAHGVNIWKSFMKNEFHWLTLKRTFLLFQRKAKIICNIQAGALRDNG